MEIVRTKGVQRDKRKNRPAERDEINRSPGSQEIIAASGISLRLWRLYAYFWLVCLFFPIFYLGRTPLSPMQLFVALGGLGLFAGGYLWVMWPHPLNAGAYDRYENRSSLILPATLALLALSLSLVYGSAFSWLFVGVSAAVGVTLPPRRAFWAIVVLTLMTLGIIVAASGGIASADWLHIVPLVLLVRVLGLDMAGLVRLSDALRELQATREELAKKAVMEERLRMARDLHDLLGHTLSMITLKSELAGRLIEKEPARAAQEIYEIEHAARQTLREAREAVAGYRKQTLIGELENSRQVLEAAGIDFKVKDTGGALLPEIDSVLAWMAREGVTNVIRHSRARECSFRLTRIGKSIQAEMINDGYTGQKNKAYETGSGLSGLTERVAAQGGRIEAGPVSDRNGQGFRLWVELPIQSNESEEGI